MLDRSNADQYHYYQPGMGTYVTTTSLSNTGIISRIKSSYLKAKDTAVGSSFADHVMAGYRFLMRYYVPGDDIYFFGFSRGAYIARFLAEMLDYVGLLTTGNEELVRFAWKTFAKWQQRTGDGAEDRQCRRELFQFMKAFRETFSRPVKRIRFVGLFDTVNSVPRFESAWMQRNKFPYTARSSAKVIRHAVGIDERRAKFRQDLISQVREKRKGRHRYGWHHYQRWRHTGEQKNGMPSVVIDVPAEENKTNGKKTNPDSEAEDSEEKPYRPSHAAASRWGGVPMLTVPQPGPHGDDDISVLESCRSQASSQIPRTDDELDDMDDGPQDIRELWFPGGHADIGGGWGLVPGEVWPLSHAPLVWMVHEAQHAGLRFDERKLKQFECDEQYSGKVSPIRRGSSQFVMTEQLDEKNARPEDGEESPEKITASESFKSALHVSSTQGHIHDCLEFGSGVSMFSVMMWKFMEYLPFRRMDLQPDGSWKPVRWPLPCGEVRDIPENAHIHVSAIRRMETNENYRPGNLIVGGGGRGVKIAPSHLGTGDWVVVSDEGDVVKETYVRRRALEPSMRNGTTNGYH